MKIMAHNDEVIRTVKTFRNYNRFSSEILSEKFEEINDRQLATPLFCGVFIAKIYVGNQVIGTYEFDCRHYRKWRKLDVLTPKLTKIDEKKKSFK